MGSTNKLVRIVHNLKFAGYQVPKRQSSSSTRFSSSSGYSNEKNNSGEWLTKKAIVAAAGAASLAYLAYDTYYKRNYVAVHALKPRKKDDEIKIKLTSRERRFLRFASVEYDGQLYMTPQDFLESVVEAEPRPRLKRKTLNKKDLHAIRDATPALQKGSPQMFRNLRDRGIVSYTEYLFLLSILTKPQTGFRIAFNMFDTDGNEKVDKNEFLVVRPSWNDCCSGITL